MSDQSSDPSAGLPADFPDMLKGPIAFVEYRMAHPARRQQAILRHNNWDVLGETPFGDTLLGPNDHKNLRILSSKPAILLSHSSGDHDPTEGVRSLGILIENIDQAIQQAWAIETADVFDGGPVGVLKLPLPAIRWNDQRLYYLIDIADGLDAVMDAMAAGR